MGDSISDILTKTLKTDRESFNARFAERRLAGYRIDGNEFLDHIATSIDPIVCAVADALPERVRATLDGLYDVSLDLFAVSLLGDGSKCLEVKELWDRVLPAASLPLARDPARVAASLSNAVYNLAMQDDTRPAWWMDRMVELANGCDDAESFLQCGRILAWQAGMAQYREPALEAARQLEPDLALRALGISDECPSPELDKVISRLESDPWLSATEALNGDHQRTTIEQVRTVGGFRGFGGVFLRPPVASCDDNGLWVSDGEFVWRMIVDTYGWYLHRSGSGAIPENQERDQIGLDRNGTARWQDVTADFPQLANAGSVACNNESLAVTVPTSHHVFILTRR